jgi:hypothetical protein
MAYDFNALVASIPPIERKTAEIDVSCLFPQTAEGEPVIFKYRDLQTKEIFSMPGLMEQVNFQRQDYPAELSGMIAILTACHISPTIEAPEMQGATFLLYCEMADRLPHEKWEWLVAAFLEAFPHLKNFDNAVEERKKK